MGEKVEDSGVEGGAAKKAADPYEVAVVEYNDVFTRVNDTGAWLLHERERSSDLIGYIEFLVNSIANSPKQFAADFEQITVLRADFVEAEVFAKQKLKDALNRTGSDGDSGYWIPTRCGSVRFGA